MNVHSFLSSLPYLYPLRSPYLSSCPTKETTNKEPQESIDHANQKDCLIWEYHLPILHSIVQQQQEEQQQQLLLLLREDPTNNAVLHNDRTIHNKNENFQIRDGTFHTLLLPNHVVSIEPKNTFTTSTTLGMMSTSEQPTSSVSVGPAFFQSTTHDSTSSTRIEKMNSTHLLKTDPALFQVYLILVSTPSSEVSSSHDAVTSTAAMGPTPTPTPTTNPPITTHHTHAPTTTNRDHIHPSWKNDCIPIQTHTTTTRTHSWKSPDTSSSVSTSISISPSPQNKKKQEIHDSKNASHHVCEPYIMDASLTYGSQNLNDRHHNTSHSHASSCLLYMGIQPIVNSFPIHEKNISRPKTHPDQDLQSHHDPDRHVHHDDVYYDTSLTFYCMDHFQLRSVTMDETDPTADSNTVTESRTAQHGNDTCPITRQEQAKDSHTLSTATGQDTMSQKPTMGTARVKPPSLLLHFDSCIFRFFQECHESSLSKNTVNLNSNSNSFHFHKNPEKWMQPPNNSYLSSTFSILNSMVASAASIRSWFLYSNSYSHLHSVLHPHYPQSQYPHHHHHPQPQYPHHHPQQQYPHYHHHPQPQYPHHHHHPQYPHQTLSSQYPFMMPTCRSTLTSTLVTTTAPISTFPILGYPTLNSASPFLDLIQRLSSSMISYTRKIRIEKDTIASSIANGEEEKGQPMAPLHSSSTHGVLTKTSSSSRVDPRLTLDRIPIPESHLPVHDSDKTGNTRQSTQQDDHLVTSQKDTHPSCTYQSYTTDKTGVESMRYKRRKSNDDDFPCDSWQCILLLHSLLSQKSDHCYMQRNSNAIFGSLMFQELVNKLQANFEAELTNHFLSSLSFPLKVGVENESSLLQGPVEELIVNNSLIYEDSLEELLVEHFPQFRQRGPDKSEGSFLGAHTTNANHCSESHDLEPVLSAQEQMETLLNEYKMFLRQSQNHILLPSRS